MLQFCTLNLVTATCMDCCQWNCLMRHLDVDVVFSQRQAPKANLASISWVQGTVQDCESHKPNLWLSSAISPGLLRVAGIEALIQPLLRQGRRKKKRWKWIDQIQQCLSYQCIFYSLNGFYAQELLYCLGWKVDSAESMWCHCRVLQSKNGGNCVVIMRNAHGHIIPLMPVIITAMPPFQIVNASLHSHSNFNHGSYGDALEF